jgi:hypothetical protein
MYVEELKRRPNADIALEDIIKIAFCLNSGIDRPPSGKPGAGRAGIAMVACRNRATRLRRTV